MKRDYEIVDVCHTIHDGMITYKGLPPPVIGDYLSRERSREFYAPGTEFHIGKIELVANTGTYLDSPFHRYPQGTDLAGLDLYSLANLEGIVVRPKADAPRSITAAAISDCDIEGRAVLFHTGWDMRWRTEGYSDGTHPFITADAAEFLVEKGAALVPLGIVSGRCKHIHRKDAFGLIAEFLSSEFEHTGSGKRSAGEEHDRKDYLRNDQDITQSMAYRAGGGIPPVAPAVRVRSLPGRTEG